VKRSTSEWVAILLAGGLALAVVSLVVGVSVAAIQNGNTASSLSDNETQVLTAAFGGMIGVLGAWVGYRAGNGHQPAEPEGWPEPQPSQHMALPHWPDKGEQTAELPPKPPE
jgi:hypothetical protein